MLRKIGYLYSRFLKKYLRGKAIINSKIDKTSVITSGSQIVNSSLGCYSYCGYDCQIINCSIGKFCSIASNVVIGSAEHPISWVSMSPVFEDVKHSGPSKRFAKHQLPTSKQTIIGNDVWIGYGSIIKAGIKIGTGAVIGSGAVVTKDVEPFAIVGGCPAKHIRYRFSYEIRKGLLDSKWWDLDDKTIEKIAYAITDPNLFIQEVNKLRSYNTE